MVWAAKLGRCSSLCCSGLACLTISHKVVLIVFFSLRAEVDGIPLGPRGTPHCPGAQQGRGPPSCLVAQLPGFRCLQHSVLVRSSCEALTTSMRGLGS